MSKRTSPHMKHRRTVLWAPWDNITRALYWPHYYRAAPPKGFGPARTFTTRKAAKTYLRQRRMIANRQNAQWAGRAQ